MNRHPKILLLALAASAIVGGISASASAQDAPATVEYKFLEDWPRHVTTVVVIRNEQKLRPMFITGRGAGGSLVFNTQDPARSTGTFGLSAGRYDSSAVNSETTAAGAWLRQDPRPTLTFRVERLTGWEPDGDQRRQRRFNVQVHGALEVDGRRLQVQAPGTIVLTGAGAVQGHNTPGRARLETRFDVQGSRLGLTGDDAGTLNILFHGYGFDR